MDMQTMVGRSTEGSSAPSLSNSYSATTTRRTGGATKEGSCSSSNDAVGGNMLVKHHGDFMVMDYDTNEEQHDMSSASHISSPWTRTTRLSPVGELGLLEEQTFVPKKNTKKRNRSTVERIAATTSPATTTFSSTSRNNDYYSPALIASKTPFLMIMVFFAIMSLGGHPSRYLVVLKAQYNIDEKQVMMSPGSGGRSFDSFIITMEKNHKNDRGVVVSHTTTHAVQPWIPTTVTDPDPNEPTLAFYQGGFNRLYGFRNQVMALTYFSMMAVDRNFTQILIPSLRLYDVGRNISVPLESIIDIQHWNSMAYPYGMLPRLVSYDPILHRQWNITSNTWNIRHPQVRATQPFAFATQLRLFSGYYNYVNSVNNNTNATRHPVDLLIMYQGALRPHPVLRDLLHQSLQKQPPKHKGTSPSNSQQKEEVIKDCTIALHARVEPDMQNHPVCRNVKERNLTNIFQSLELYFGNQPPCSRLFVATNRNLLENEVQRKGKRNPLAVYNLAALNKATQFGLWDGRVTVLEAGGAAVASSTVGQEYPTLTASVLDFELCVQAKIFVGTEVSTFSIDVWATRFFQNRTDSSTQVTSHLNHLSNYKYLPGQRLELVFPPNAQQPPVFKC